MNPLLFTLSMTDNGVDGWDAKTTQVAQFTSEDKTLEYLKRRGFTYKSGNEYYHTDEKKRHCMGAISYRIKPPTLPIDPE